MKVPRTVALALVAGFLIGCDSEQLPANSSLDIAPSERKLIVDSVTQPDGSCIYNPESYIDYPFVARLTGPDGSPLGDAALRVYLSFAENTFSGLSVMALYVDRNGNGVVDADTELVSSADDDIAILKTDEVSGQKAFLVRANTSCPYKGEIFVYGDGVAASANIVIVDQNVASEMQSEEGQ